MIRETKKDMTNIVKRSGMPDTTNKSGGKFRSEFFFEGVSTVQI
jgi:hypothetical protein